MITAEGGEVVREGAPQGAFMTAAVEVLAQ